jgi:hypothetical protein
MIQMSVSEQEEINFSRFEPERSVILLTQLPFALVETAINEQFLVIAFDKVTGTCHIVVGAMEGNFRCH